MTIEDFLLSVYVQPGNADFLCYEEALLFSLSGGDVGASSFLVSRGVFGAERQYPFV